MEKVDCLLDTNAIVKHYHAEDGSDVINYLFDKAPAELNILNIQIAEVVTIFYTLRRLNEIKTDSDCEALIDTFFADIRDKRLMVYDFTNEHLKNMDIFRTVHNTPRIKRKFYNPHMKNKERCDAIDTIMLIVAKEITDCTRNAFLVTGDEHAIAVAQKQRIKTINPNEGLAKALPFCLDVRNSTRRKVQAKAICKNKTTGQSVGTMQTFDISRTGMRIKSLRAVSLNDELSIQFLRGGGKVSQSIKGNVLWRGKNTMGVHFASEISLKKLSSN